MENPLTRRLHQDEQSRHSLLHSHQNCDAGESSGATVLYVLTKDSSAQESDSPLVLFPPLLLPPQCGLVGDQLRSVNLDARLNRGFDRHLIDRERQGSRNSQVKRSRENPRAKR